MALASKRNSLSLFFLVIQFAGRQVEKLEYTVINSSLIWVMQDAVKAQRSNTKPRHRVREKEAMPMLRLGHFIQLLFIEHLCVGRYLGTGDTAVNKCVPSRA